MRKTNPVDSFEAGDPAMFGRSSTMGLLSSWAKWLFFFFKVASYGFLPHTTKKIKKKLDKLS